MTHRLRMARKRLMVARERVKACDRTLGIASLTAERFWNVLPQAERLFRREATLRAIERRKDRTS